MREDVEEFDGVRNASRVGAMGVVGQSVDEGDDDVLDIDCLLHVSTGLQELVESLQVELIWEHLREREREREGAGIQGRDREKWKLNGEEIIS